MTDEHEWVSAQPDSERVVCTRCGALATECQIASTLYGQPCAGPTREETER